MKKALLAVIIILAASNVVASQSSGSRLPDPGVMPGSAFYGLDTALDHISLTLTFDPEKKAELHMRIARERLSEAKTLADRNDSRDASEALERFRSSMKSARRETSDLPEERRANVSRSINLTYEDNIKVLNQVSRKVPGKASDRIKRDIQRMKVNERRHLPVGGPATGGFIGSGHIQSAE
ncbi:MAG: DUF5667 domain-containing protein [Candidatus Nanohaloarchaea archaeon]